MRLFVIALGLLSSSVAWSHGLHATEPGFASGLLHPLTGIDHMMAAVGMGLWLSLQRFTPLSIPLYAGSLISGIVIAIFSRGMVTDFEWVLAATLILIGLFLLNAWRMPQQWAAAVMTVFCTSHFYAHLSEMPEGMAAPGYVSGFLLCTCLLVAVGIVIGSGRHFSRVWLRIAGAVITVTGAAAFGLA